MVWNWLNSWTQFEFNLLSKFEFSVLWRVDTCVVAQNPNPYASQTNVLLQCFFLDFPIFNILFFISFPSNSPLSSSNLDLLLLTYPSHRAPFIGTSKQEHCCTTFILLHGLSCIYFAERDGIVCTHIHLKLFWFTVGRVFSVHSVIHAADSRFTFPLFIFSA